MLIRFSLILIFLSSCSSSARYAEFYPYHDNGTVKPKVVFLPIQSLEDKDCQKAETLQDLIFWEALDSGELFIYSKDSVIQALGQNQECNPICFRPAEYVVQVELIEFDAISQKQMGAKLRLKITDIRYESPKVILYEVMEKSRVNPKQEYPQVNFNRFCKEIAKDACYRIEEVIKCTK